MKTSLLENGLVFYISMTTIMVVELIFQTAKSMNLKQVLDFYFKVSTYRMVFKKSEDTQDILSHSGSQQTSIDVCH